MSITARDIIDTQGKHPERAAKAGSDVFKNATELAEKLTRLETSYGHAFDLNSGYRTVEANKAAGGAVGSHHCSGRAADINDPDGELGIWCLAEQDLLAHFGLWLENPLWTRKRKLGHDSWSTRWVHLQTKAPPSGMRVFRPAGPQPR